MDHFVTQATNFFDHNPIGNSNVFLPITIEGALIRAWEHLLIDNSLTFGGFHYNEPRQVYAELQYRFNY
jgi:hypothetical protein